MGIPDLEKLIQLLNEFGLAHRKDEIPSVVKPSIRFIVEETVADESTLLPGMTKFGGQPDLPLGMEWGKAGGKYLPFLAQIRMEDVRPFDSEDILPADGILYFFYDQEFDLMKVSYTPDSYALQRVPFPESLDNWERYLPTRITCRTELTIPESEAKALDFLGQGYISTPDKKQYNEMLLHIREENEGFIHRMLGYPEIIQFADILQDVDDVLLLQLDSDGDLKTFNNSGWMWGDVGTLSFCIPAEMLRQQNFDHVYHVLESC